MRVRPDEARAILEDAGVFAAVAPFDGRFIGSIPLDLHGEEKGGYRQSDALCNALQVINHLQDCADDYAGMDRVYLPQQWLREAGAVTEDLAKPATTPNLRRVMDQCLDGTEKLLREARRLPKALQSKRLALESAVIVRIADRLTLRLMHEDPIATRVELSKPAALRCAASTAAPCPAAAGCTAGASIPRRTAN